MQALYDYMRTKGLTQIQLAERIGVPQGQLNHWLNARRIPGGLSLKRISDATGLSLDKLAKDMCERVTPEPARPEGGKDRRKAANRG